MQGIKREILLQLSKGNRNFDYEFFGLDKATFMNVSEELSDDGLVRGVTIDYTGGNYSAASITPRGLDFLDE